jgi:hypothetical protein
MVAEPQPRVSRRCSARGEARIPASRFTLSGRHRGRTARQVAAHYVVCRTSTRRRFPGPLGRNAENSVRSNGRPSGISRSALSIAPRAVGCKPWSADYASKILERRPADC